VFADEFLDRKVILWVGYAWVPTQDENCDPQKGPLNGLQYQADALRVYAGIGVNGCARIRECGKLPSRKLF